MSELSKVNRPESGANGNVHMKFVKMEIKNPPPMKTHPTDFKVNIDDLVQDCSVSIANALEILQSCAKPSTWVQWNTLVKIWGMSP